VERTAVTIRNGVGRLKRGALTVAVVAGVLLSVILSVREVCAEPLRLGVYRGAESALAYLADSEGFFKKQGIDVVMKEYETGVLAVNDLIADREDVATATQFAFVLQAFKYPDLRVPATISASTEAEFVVRKDRAVTRPQDLKGKQVAVVRGTSSEFFLYTYLIFNSVPAGTVRVVYHTPSEMVKAMADGTLDAALCWPPYTSRMEKQLGANGAVWPAQSGQEMYVALFAKEKYLRTQPKTMRQFLAALSDAEDLVAKYPDRAQAILRNRLKIDDELFLATWSRTRTQLQLTQDLLLLMEREAKWAIRNRLIEKREMPNYLDFMYFDALDKVKPEAVSIVH
jgi:ABC-type nitrate/sulfonate/bicarbonate transport system substrate-binding protein